MPARQATGTRTASVAMQKVGRIRKGGAFEICDAETPQAGADDVIVEVGSCGICGTDQSTNGTCS